MFRWFFIPVSILRKRHTSDVALFEPVSSLIIGITSEIVVVKELKLNNRF